MHTVDSSVFVDPLSLRVGYVWCSVSILRALYLTFFYELKGSCLAKIEESTVERDLSTVFPRLDAWVSGSRLYVACMASV